MRMKKLQQNEIKKKTARAYLNCAVGVSDVAVVVLVGAPVYA
jgi:hypothetical protein